MKIARTPLEVKLLLGGRNLEGMSLYLYKAFDTLLSDEITLQDFPILI
jgi:hypothetical protein